MSNGKRILKSGVVIQSIKPPRPVFPPNTKLVPVEQLQKAWDGLDAYYRGQILNLESKIKKLRQSKKDIKITIGKKKDSRHTSINQLSELFGDENVTLAYEESDVENQSPPHLNKTNKDKSLLKKKSSGKVSRDLKQENYVLSIPRENFVIEFAIGEQRRTPVHRPDPPGFITPIKIEPYKPPLRAVGFNGDHIEKILSHRNKDNNESSPNSSSPSSTFSSSPPLISTEKENKSRVPQKVSRPIIPNIVNATNAAASTNAVKRKSSVKNNNCTMDNGDDDRMKMPAPPKRKALDKNVVVKDKGFVVPRLNPSNPLSITEMIIQKSKEPPKELKERERQRQKEIEKRKAYAMKMSHEQLVMDSVDAAMKAMEMIWNVPPISPIRSPNLIS